MTNMAEKGDLNDKIKMALYWI